MFLSLNGFDKKAIAAILFEVDEELGKIILKGMKTRIILNLPLENIDLFVLSDYDLIISKLGSARPKDIHDIIESGLIFKIDFDRLEEIIKEELASVGDPKRLWGDIEYLRMLRNEKGE